MPSRYSICAAAPQNVSLLLQLTLVVRFIQFCKSKHTHTHIHTTTCANVRSHPSWGPSPFAQLIWRGGWICSAWLSNTADSAQDFPLLPLLIVSAVTRVPQSHFCTVRTRADCTHYCTVRTKARLAAWEPSEANRIFACLSNLLPE